MAESANGEHWFNGPSSLTPLHFITKSCQIPNYTFYFWMFMFEIMQTHLYLSQFTILIFSQVSLSECYLENPGYKNFHFATSSYGVFLQSCKWTQYSLCKWRNPDTIKRFQLCGIISGSNFEVLVLLSKITVGITLSCSWSITKTFQTEIVLKGLWPKARKGDHRWH